jgi:hypothetical protein
MGRHLNVERWFDKTSTGTLRKKRVSAARAEQFPQRYRNIYRTQGLANLVRLIMQENDLSLADAWQRVKSMFND